VPPPATPKDEHPEPAAAPTVVRRLLQLVAGRMIVKVFLAVASVVCVVLLGLAWREDVGETALLKQETQLSARQLADLIIGGIDHAMLEGDGIAVTQLVERSKHQVPQAEIRVFDRRGAEVFGEKAPPPRDVPARLASVLAGGPRSTSPDGQVLRPLSWDERCASCHPPSPVRGVLGLEAAARFGPADREAQVGRLVSAGFVQMMTARRQGMLDRYLAELSARAPTLKTVGVYDSDGELAFGTAAPGVDRELLRPLLARGAAPRSLPAPRTGATLRLVPLPREARCAACHKDHAPVRGVLALSLRDLPDRGDAGAEELASIIDASIRMIMLSKLGRMITTFLDEVTVTGAFTDLRLWDPEGRLYYQAGATAGPPYVVQALGTTAPVVLFSGAGHQERVVVAHALSNRAECAVCHGQVSPVRGAVTVSLSTAAAAEARAAAGRRTGLVMIAALGAILAILYLLLQSLVIRPIATIGDVVEQVGQGRLDVSVARASPLGDEVVRLGSRINDMIRGLRTKLILERFVSRGAAEVAEVAAGRSATEKMAGERRGAVILFSDIRNFTAYCETVPPERVVDLLNRFLEAQAEVVEAHGGDIDKFVGDELMAVFVGARAEERAVRAAVELSEAIDRIRQPGETLQIGVGVSSGDVIYGPMGAQRRMDFTVIGDVVNTGARLCAAAAGREVIVAASVRAACGDSAGLHFTPLPPLVLKGKRDPFPVFRASRG
jgi:class 3 adenylate cyclase